MYSAKVLGKVPTKPGCWDYLRVGVFEDDKLIGEYQRNYYCLYSTFFPFQQDGKWYALYSKDYTCTRVMSLPDCKDICGEDESEYGFCPVEFFVPCLTGRKLNPEDSAPTVANHDAEKWALKVGNRYYWPDCKDHPQPNEEKKEAYLKAKKESHAVYDSWSKRNPIVTEYAKWGFVAGCVWGDDSSWKIQFLDLSKISEGVLTRDDRFDYIELPPRVSLEDAIHIDYVNDLNAPFEQMTIHIAQSVPFKLTGEKVKDD